MEGVLEPQEWAAWRAFAMASRRVASALERRLQADAGVSAADFEILNALADAPEGQMRAGELGDMLAWEKSRISHHVTRMVARGLVDRVRCDSDARGTWVEIADAGTAALAVARPAYADEVRKTFLEPVGVEPAVTAAAIRVARASGPGVCEPELDRIDAAASTTV